MDNFTRGYITCALWSSIDDDGIPLDDSMSVDDIAPASLERMQADCAKFQRDNEHLLVQSSRPDDYKGHDFWLTRNRHGVGFWDRGDEELGEALTRAAHSFGEHSLYVGDDGLIHGV